MFSQISDEAIEMRSKNQESHKRQRDAMTEGEFRFISKFSKFLNFADEHDDMLHKRKEKRERLEKTDHQLSTRERRHKRMKSHMRYQGAAWMYDESMDVPDLDIGQMNEECEYCGAMWFPREVKVRELHV